ncbi:MAG: Hsp20/alpha crystallin family protein [bacterium]|nr:Hsp20/alpha crystallin family protein [bacterium]
MSLIRCQPRDTFALDREIDTLVNQIWGDAPSRAGQVGLPKVDIAENENAFVLHAEVPGLKREDIQVSLEEGVLTLSGEHKEEAEKQGKNYLHRGRYYGRFSRSFKLGKNVNVESIKATYSDGILTVTLPKAEEVKPRQIQVAVS